MVNFFFLLPSAFFFFPWTGKFWVSGGKGGGDVGKDSGSSLSWFIIAKTKGGGWWRRNGKAVDNNEGQLRTDRRERELVG